MTQPNEKRHICNIIQTCKYASTIVTSAVTKTAHRTPDARLLS